MTYTELKILKETEKAIQIEAYIGYSKKPKQTWLPKSQIQYHYGAKVWGEQTDLIEVPDWLASKKMLLGVNENKVELAE